MEQNFNWYDKPLSDITTSVNVKEGLTTTQAQSNLEKFGPNKLEEEKKRSILWLFLDQFKDVMIIILIIAAFISGMLGETIDAIIILAIVVLNAILGVYQENKAENALQALQDLSAPTSKVIRDGIEKTIPSEELVLGDVVVLEAGDLVNADLRLTKTSSLKIQEASLTGESVPVDKDAEVVVDIKAPLGDRLNMAYSSGQVTYGRGLGVVVGTGMHTEVGKIASILSSTKTELTPLQKQLNQLGKVLGIVAIIAVFGIFVIGVFNGKEPFEMFMTAVSLAVAVIPESLPTVSTIVLSMGVQKMVEQHAIIRTLPSVETLGSTTVICSDKTGTLTQNKMTVTDSWTLNNNEDLLKRTVYLCNDSRYLDGVWVGDPTETAMSEWSQGVSDFERIAEVPFDSTRKRMTTVNLVDGQPVVHAKGGVDEILSISTHIQDGDTVREITQEDRVNIQRQNESMASNALRVLAGAIKPVEGEVKDGDFGLESNLIFVGLVGMIDPARPEVKEAIYLSKRAGIRVVMITGDHAVTAEAIGREIGLLEDGQEVITGPELDDMSDQELTNRVKNIGVYARVSPEHKMRIIDAWKSHGEIVAMTGDGVNDAPALKKADIGAAMGIVGTEVAKGASDMVLTDDNFATVVAAVKEGRRIRTNIKKAIQYLLSCNTGELFTLLIATVFNWPTPLLAIHILWINLVTDSLPALALGVDPAEEDIMDEQPDRSQTLFTKDMAWRVLYQGIMIGTLTIIAFLFGAGKLGYSSGSVEQGQTMAFAVLGFSQLVHSFNIHSPHQSVFKTFFVNHRLIQAVVINAVMMLVVLLVPPVQDIFKLVPLDMQHWIVIVILQIVPLFIVEGMKKLGLNGKD
ncbi:MAG: cation-translocating P-type ATPase [Erysipelothrix sp.]|nr:cation-translocating P-type ATPase [Erysipelothrix sp.]